MYSFDQAVRASPILSEVALRIDLSRRLMSVVQALLPPPICAHVQAGPVENNTWCLLAANPSVANKLKQLTPTLLAAIHQAGYEVSVLRIKVRRSMPR